MHIFLDFDGTLVDSSNGIYRSLSKASVEIGLDPPSLANFRSMIGPPFISIAASLYPSLSNEKLSHFLAAFRREYDSHDYALVNWHEGVIDVLKDLYNDANTIIYIVTNKPTQPTRLIIKEAGLCGYFQDVIGIDYRQVEECGAIFADKSEALAFALMHAGCSTSNAVYIGDTPSDRDSCRRIDLAFVGVAYGFHSWSSDEIGTDKVANSFKDAIHLIGRTS